MLTSSLAVFGALVYSALGCPDHTNNRRRQLNRRQDVTEPGGNTTQNDWAYEASFNWGRINPDYRLCQTGTQVSLRRKTFIEPSSSTLLIRPCAAISHRTELK